MLTAKKRYVCSLLWRERNAYSIRSSNINCANGRETQRSVKCSSRFPMAFTASRADDSGERFAENLTEYSGHKVLVDDRVKDWEFEINYDYEIQKAERHLLGLKSARDRYSWDVRRNPRGGKRF